MHWGRNQKQRTSIGEHRQFIVDMIVCLEKQLKIIRTGKWGQLKIKIEHSAAFLNARDNWLFDMGSFTIGTKIKIKLTRIGEDTILWEK